MDRRQSKMYPLPSELADTRKIYKLHSQKVIEWVVTTEDLCRKTDTHPTSLQQGGGWQTVGKKGKEKAKGKGKGKTKNGKKQPSSSSNPYAPKITLANFTVKVDAIVEAKVRAPSEIIACLANVIKFRKVCAAFFSTDENAWKSNSRHRHAIGVFIDAWVKLGGKTADSEALHVNRGEYLDYTHGIPGAPTETPSVPDVDLPKSSKDKACATPKSTLDNEWLRDNPLMSKTKGAKTPQHEVPLEDYTFSDDDFESGPDAMLIAIIAFFCDVDKIRRYCQRVWRRVDPTGPISRVSASLVTTQAVELVKQLERELKAEFPDNLKSTEDIYSVIKTNMPGMMTEEAKETAEDALMMTVQSSWDEFREYVQNPFSPRISELEKLAFNDTSTYSLYAQRARSDRPRNERLFEDRFITRLLLVDTAYLLKMCPELPLNWPHKYIGDEGLGTEFMGFNESTCYSISLGLIFSTQLVLDIFYIRRERNCDDRKIMRTVYKRVSGQYDQILNDTSTPELARFTQLMSNLYPIRQCLDHEMGTDTFYEYRAKETKLQWDFYEKDRLWMLNPWLASNAITYALQQYWEQGTLLSQGNDYMQGVIEIWNFLKQMGLLSDVLRNHPEPGNLLPEYLIENFGQQLFPEGKPVTHSFMLSSFIRTGKRSYDHTNPQPGTGLNCQLSRIFNVLRSRNGRVFELNKILREKERQLKEDKIVGTSRKKGPKGSVISDHDRLLNPLETLLELVQSEVRNEPIMGLDLFKIRQVCYTFLVQLHQELKKGPANLLVFFRTAEDCQEDGPSGTTPDERFMPATLAANLMGCILIIDPAGSQTIEGVRFREAPKRIARHSWFLKKAAELVAHTVGKWETKDFLTTADV